MAVRQVKQAGACMAVDIFKGLFLAGQVLENFNQHDVLQDIGKIPGVKRMAVAQQDESLSWLGIPSFKHILIFTCVQICFCHPRS